MKEDWDTLILLDVCRYDISEERVSFDGELESRISLGLTCEEFLRQNFEAGSTTIPSMRMFNLSTKLGVDQDETFHAVVDLLDNWDEELEITFSSPANLVHHPFNVVQDPRQLEPLDSLLSKRHN